LKADLAAALGTTKLRNIAREDADVTEAERLNISSMFSPGQFDRGEGSGVHVTCMLTRV